MECKILVGADGAYSKASTPSVKIGWWCDTLDEFPDRGVDEPEWGGFCTVFV